VAQVTGKFVMLYLVDGFLSFSSPVAYSPVASPDFITWYNILGTLWASVERASSKRGLSIGSAAPVPRRDMAPAMLRPINQKSGSRHCRELFVPHTLFDIDCIIPGDMGEFLCCQAQP